MLTADEMLKVRCTTLDEASRIAVVYASQLSCGAVKIPEFCGGEMRDVAAQAENRDRQICEKVALNISCMMERRIDEICSRESDEVWMWLTVNDKGVDKRMRVRKEDYTDWLNDRELTRELFSYVTDEEFEILSRAEWKLECRK